MAAKSAAGMPGKFLLTLLPALLFVADLRADGFGYRLTAEGGLYRPAYRSTAADAYLAGGLNAYLKYLRQIKNGRWQVSGNMRPEYFWGADGSEQLLQLRFKSIFQRKINHLDTRLNFAAEKQYFNLGGISIRWDILQLNGTIGWRYNAASALALTLGYHFRDIDTNGINTLDVYSGTVSWLRSISFSRKFSLYLYGEYFIESSRFQFTPEENKGWRAGPGVSLDYHRIFKLKTSYRLLLRKTDGFPGVSERGFDNFEHWLQLVGAHGIGKFWSLLLLFDVHIQSHSGDPREAGALFYIPIDSQNRISLKIDRDLNRKSNLYFRVGYLQEELLRENRSGWRAVAGISIRN